jgi:hypothetical protein
VFEFSRDVHDVPRVGQADLGGVAIAKLKLAGVVKEGDDTP